MNQLPFIFQPRKAPRRRERPESKPAGLLITSVERQAYAASVTILAIVVTV